MSIQSLALMRCASGLSPGKPLKIGLGEGARPPGPGVGNATAAACIAATICAKRAAPAGGVPGAPGAPGEPGGLVGLVAVTVVVVVPVLLVRLAHLAVLVCQDLHLLVGLLP